MALEQYVNRTGSPVPQVEFFAIDQSLESFKPLEGFEVVGIADISKAFKHGSTILHRFNLVHNAISRVEKFGGKAPFVQNTILSKKEGYWRQTLPGLNGELGQVCKKFNFMVRFW